MVRKFNLPEFGYEVEIGKYARQADGAVWLKKGGTVILATVVSSPSREFPGFLPLSVEYREQFAAAGKIPGGYYKREGKPSDKEVLTSRLIDRTIRPLFPENYFNQIQVVATVLSVDKEHTPHALALTASSLALAYSKIPLVAPVGSIEMARVDGNWIVDPLYSEVKKSDVRFVIAGTEEGICMVEGSGFEISEDEFVDVLFKAHEEIKKVIAWQVEIIQEVNIPDEEPEDPYHWFEWVDRANVFLTEDRVAKTYIADKSERNTYLAELKKEFATQFESIVVEQEVPLKVVEYIFDQALKPKITDYIFKVGKRIDGRSFDEVRKLDVEVGVLPATHGSGLFTRGSDLSRTQALVSLTLGSGQDEQRIENIMEDETYNSNFMLHYNFPPFSVGETRPMRGPGRREVGHGYLAASSLLPIMPLREDFSYTIRLVSDILESNGSSSMATVCGATMALMDGGVPIREMVSGIAMGLIRNKNGDFIVLSDITGFEDAFGIMDFKVAGPEKGITAVQMDIKYRGGLPRDIFVSAMKQARVGRLHILAAMKNVMAEPNKELNEKVPRLVTLNIIPDKIGAIIGGGGKTIREITDQTGTSIDIEPDGLVKIFGGPEADIPAAINWVKTLAGQIEPGSVYEGVIRRLVDFGMFVELVPGQDGLVHVSNIPRDKQKTFAKDFEVGQKVTVEVVEYDSDTGRIRLRLLA